MPWDGLQRSVLTDAPPAEPRGCSADAHYTGMCISTVAGTPSHGDAEARLSSSGEGDSDVPHLRDRDRPGHRRRGLDGFDAIQVLRAVSLRTAALRNARVLLHGSARLRCGAGDGPGGRP